MENGVSLSSLNTLSPSSHVSEYSPLPSPIVKKRTKGQLILEKLALNHIFDDSNTAKVSEIDSETARLVRQLAIGENGLVSDEIRRHIWPILSQALMTGEQEEEEDDNFDNPDELDHLSNHPQHGQVKMDVMRTLARFPPHINDTDRYRLQNLLIPLMVRIVHRHPTLSYYQGFHDVCLTILLVMEDPAATYRICRRLACAVFRTYLEKDLRLSMDSLDLMYPLFKRVDPELYEFLWRSDCTTAFGVSWVLTWFAHDIDDYATVVRLYDLFLASHPLMPVYFGAALILYRSPQVLALECDQPSVHSFLSKIPANLPLEALISDAQDLFVEYPPSVLKEMQVALKKEQERIEHLRQVRKRHSSWPLVIARASRRRPATNAIKITLWSVTAAAAAYYFYSRYPLHLFRLV